MLGKAKKMILNALDPEYIVAESAELIFSGKNDNNDNLEKIMELS